MSIQSCIKQIGYDLEISRLQYLFKCISEEYKKLNKSKSNEERSNQFLKSEFDPLSNHSRKTTGLTASPTNVPAWKEKTTIRNLKSVNQVLQEKCLNLTTQKSALIESIHEANNGIHEARETLTVYMEENEKLKENVNRTKDIQDELNATKQALSSARQSAYYKRLKRKEAALEKKLKRVKERKLN